MQPIDTAWNILKSRTERDQSGSITGEAYGRPGKFRQPQTMKDIEPPMPGPARSTQTNRMKREMDRQRQDQMMGDMRDPFAANEEDMQQVRRDTGPAPPASPAMAKPDPVSPEFIQQLMAEGGSFGLPPKLRQAAEEMRRKEMANKLIGMG